MARCYFCDIIIKRTRMNRRKTLSDRILCRTCIDIAELEIYHLWPKEETNTKEKRNVKQNFKYLIKSISLQTVQECISEMLLKNSYSQQLLTKIMGVK